MYQPCTRTAVNRGEQRGGTVTRKRAVSRPKEALPGTAESFGPGLITRRSQVQILPPPLDERPGHMAWAFDVVRGASPTTSTGSSKRELLTWCFAAEWPVDVYRLAVATRVANCSAAVALMPGSRC